MWWSASRRALVQLLPLLLWSSVAHAEALQVVILAGQSNMQGHAHVRTFAHLAMDPASAPLLARMQNADGTPTVCERVWISCLGSADQEMTGRLTVGFGAGGRGDKIGPEFTFGIQVQRHTTGRVLLIKTAWGGKSLHTDFRPPSAGPYVFNDQQIATFQKQGKDLAAEQAAKVAETGVYYRLMIEHVKRVLADPKRVVPDHDPAHGIALAGFVWFQGWNDLVDGGVYPERDKPDGYAAYSDTLAHFIRDVRKDLAAPKLPFVIGVLGVNGPPTEFPPGEQRYRASHENFRNAMAAPAALPEFAGTVAAVRTERYWDRELTVLRAKEQVLRQQAKKQAGEPGATEKEPAIFARLRAEQLSERERQVLDVGVSNAEYHYLGSTKILGGIGVGLAEALISLNGWKEVAP